MRKVDNFTIEEIQTFWYDSLTKMEFSKKIGYNSSGHVKEIQTEFNLLDEDLGKNNNNNKKYMIGPKGTRIEDLTGQTFYHWHVLGLDEEKTKNDYKHSWWICKCDCEKQTIRSITMNNLKKGASKSCGCNLVRASDMIGKKYGKLEVLSEDKNISSKRGIYVICKCDCGNIKSICCTDIKRGKVNSCGCIISKGELKIKNILKSLNIIFEEQYTFKDLKSIKGYPLKFDFAIFDKNNILQCLLEFQGQQHFEAIPIFGGEDKFNQQIKNDELKRIYCQNNNILLIEIPYWSYDQLDENYIKERLNICMDTLME